MRRDIELKMTNAERMVKEYLENKGYSLMFEKPIIIIDNGERHRVWYPEFYIYELDLYVEVCGVDRPEDYDRRKMIYANNNVDILFAETFKEDYKWQYYLDCGIEKFRFREKGKIKTFLLKNISKIRQLLFFVLTIMFIVSWIFYSSRVWFSSYVIPVYAIISVAFLLSFNNPFAK